MIRLADIAPAAWVPVATRVQAGAVDAWDWRLSWWDQSLFAGAVEAGHVLTAQRREPDGRIVLLARRPLPPVPRHDRRATRGVGDGVHAGVVVGAGGVR